MADPIAKTRRARSPQGLYRLSARAVETISKPGWHADGGGLYLEVDPSGRKRWAMRVTVNGKRRDFGSAADGKLTRAESSAAVSTRSL